MRLAVINNGVGSSRSATQGEVGLTFGIDTELVGAILAHDRAGTGQLDVGEDAHTVLGLQGVLGVSELLGGSDHARRAARRNHAILVVHGRRGVLGKLVASHVRKALDGDLQLLTGCRRLIEGDVIRGVVRRALDLAGINILTVDGKDSVALDLLGHLDCHRLGSISCHLGNDRGLGVLLLGHINGEGLLGRHVPGHVLSDGEGALVGDGGLLAALNIVALNNVVVLVALLALDAKGGVVEREADVLVLAPLGVADGDDTLIAIKSRVTIGVVRTVGPNLHRRARVRRTGLELDALGRTLAEHLGVAEHVEVGLRPLQELGCNLILLGIENRIGEVELPEGRTTAGDGVEVVLELLSSRSIGSHGGAGLAVHRIMIIDVSQRELELMVLDVAVVSSVAGIHLTVHLAVRLVLHAHTGAGLVRTALEPDGVGPLEEPRRRVHIAGERNPLAIETLLITCVTDGLK